MNVFQDNKGAILKFMLFIIVILTIVFFGIKLSPMLIDMSKNPASARDYILSIGMLGGAVFVLILVAHIILAIVPGDFLYLLGGFAFGMPLGFALSYIGIMVGVFLAFYFSRLLGYDFVNRFISHDKIDKISNLLNSNKGMLAMAMICLIPIIPKDPLTYVAGLTPIKASKFFTISGIARIPITLMWVMIGANVYERNYFQIFTILAVIFIIVIISLVIQKKYLKNHNSIEKTA